MALPLLLTPLVALPLILLASCGAEPPPTNLLLITLDTLRADHLGSYGYPRPTSPRLDAFASRSTLFADVTCSMPTTLPSHLTIFTGLPPDQHGVWSNGRKPETDLLSLFDLLAERGWQTAAVVASGVLAGEFLGGMGFQEILEEDLETHGHQLPGSLVSQRAQDWLRKRGPEPFALWVHFYDTHEPYAPDAETANLFTEGYTGPLGERLTGPWLNQLNRKGSAHLSAADRRHIINLYDAEIRQLDTAVGSLLQTLETSGDLERTLVAIVGDHGQALGEQTHFGHGEWLLEPIIKTPLILHLPGQRQGRVVQAPVETLDLLPTLGDLFDLPVAKDLPGRSLAPALAGEPLAAAGPRLTFRRLYAQDPERRGITVSRGDEKWTLLREPAGDLFHLGRNDGRGGLDGENFHRPGSAASEALSAFVETMTRPPNQEAPISPETRAMLQSLGYVD